MELQHSATRSVFVGRTHELRSLRGALDETLNARGRLVLLAGEPGIGKTRTAAEFATEARSAGAEVLWGGCYDGEWAPPFGPFAEAIAAYARQCEPGILRDDLGFGAAPIARVVPAVRERLPDLPGPVALQPDEERFRLLDAVSQLFIAIAARTPIVLVLDDLHWADKGTLAILRHVARFAPQHRLLVLGTYRDVELDAPHPLTDALGALYRESTCERILLKGLEPKEVAQLIADSNVPARHRDTWVRVIGAATNGNPFFICEVLRQFNDDDEVGVPDDPTSIEKIGIPDSVRQVLSRRVRRLSSETGRLLSVAAAFRGPFHLTIAADVAGLEDAPALNAIDAALRAQLIRPADNAERYAFTHALIGDTLYAELSPSRQARLHRRIAESMERISGARGEHPEHAAEIAQQYYRSRDLPGAERGATFAVAAADRAEQAYARDEVVRCLRMASELLPKGDARWPRLCGRLAAALAWAHSFEEALALSREAAERIAQTESPHAVADYIAGMLPPMHEGGFFQGAFALAREGLRCAGTRRDATWASLRAMDIIRRENEAGDNPGIALDTPERREVGRVCQAVWRDARGELTADLPAHLWFFWPHSRDDVQALSGGRHFADGGYRRGLLLLRDDAVNLQRQGRIAAAVGAWAGVFERHTALGEFDQAQEARARSVALAARLPAASTFTSILMAAEDAWRMARDEGWDQPMNAFGPGVGQGRVLASFRAEVRAAAARIHARMGRKERALRRLAAVIPAIDKAPAWAESYAKIACDAAETLWLTWRTDHIDVIERNLREKVIAPDFHCPMTDGRLALARLCALQERFAEAVEWFAKARAVLDEQGARPLRAIVDYDEALMYARRGEPGDAARAQSLLEAALTQFRAIGMPGWIRRAEHLLNHGTEWVPETAARGETHTDQPPPDSLLGKEGEQQPAIWNRGPGTGDQRPGTNVLRREGHFWTVIYAGRPVRLKNSKGMHYIAQLLHNPGRELLAFDMISHTSAELQRSAVTETVPRHSDDLGPLLDAQAKREYRERVRELREELDEATANNDLGRAAALQAEIELIAEQLRTAVGLGGKDRTPGAVSERARLTVTKRIKAVLKELDTLHPPLAHHLRACLKTGRICIYVPPPGPPTPWEF